MRARDLSVKMGLDWGQASPGVVLWGAALPDNHAHIFDEMKFQRMSVREVAQAIRERTLGVWKLKGLPTIYCDPALKAKTGQIGEDYLQTFARHKVALTPVSNHRTAGWQRVHEALSVNPANELPWLTVHPRCKYLIRTIPAMLQDDHDPEDLDTDSDDHACDALRYLLMGGLRHTARSARREAPAPNTWGWWREFHESRERGTGVLA
jgi:hypothetical protein